LVSSEPRFWRALSKISPHLVCNGKIPPGPPWPAPGAGATLSAANVPQRTPRKFYARPDSGFCLPYISKRNGIRFPEKSAPSPQGEPVFFSSEPGVPPAPPGLRGPDETHHCEKEQTMAESKKNAWFFHFREKGLRILGGGGGTTRLSNRPPKAAHIPPRQRKRWVPRMSCQEFQFPARVPSRDRDLPFFLGFFRPGAGRNVSPFPWGDPDHQGLPPLETLGRMIKSVNWAHSRPV